MSPIPVTANSEDFTSNTSLSDEIISNKKIAHELTDDWLLWSSSLKTKSLNPLSEAAFDLSEFSTRHRELTIKAKESELREINLQAEKCATEALSKITDYLDRASIALDNGASICKTDITLLTATIRAISETMDELFANAAQNNFQPLYPNSPESPNCPSTLLTAITDDKSSMSPVRENSTVNLVSRANAAMSTIPNITKLDLSGLDKIGMSLPYMDLIHAKDERPKEITTDMIKRLDLSQIEGNSSFTRRISAASRLEPSGQSKTKESTSIDDIVPPPPPFTPPSILDSISAIVGCVQNLPNSTSPTTYPSQKPPNVQVPINASIRSISGVSVKSPSISNGYGGTMLQQSTLFGTSSNKPTSSLQSGTQNTFRGPMLSGIGPNYVQQQQVPMHHGGTQYMSSGGGTMNSQFKGVQVGTASDAIINHHTGTIQRPQMLQSSQVFAAQNQGYANPTNLTYQQQQQINGQYQHYQQGGQSYGTAQLQQQLVYGFNTQMNSSQLSSLHTGTISGTSQSLSRQNQQLQHQSYEPHPGQIYGPNPNHHAMINGGSQMHFQQSSSNNSPSMLPIQNPSLLRQIPTDTTGLARQQMSLNGQYQTVRHPVAKVLYAYQATEPDEMSLIPGELIEILLLDAGAGWSRGVSSDRLRAGMFPRTYAQILD